MNIKKVSLEDDFQLCSSLLNEAFATVAEGFALTKENCPTNNAFITGDELKAQLTENKEFYCLFEADDIVGFIAIEQSKRDNTLFYIEKVAVHPCYRHRGAGEQLMNFATMRIVELGGKTISIGLINSNLILKKWYLGQGYSETEVKSFSHLPFDVCYMEKSIP